MGYIDKIQNRDPQMQANAHVSHFGALKTSSTTPIVRASFPGSTLDTDVWTETVANGATATIGSGVADLETSTNSAGSVKLISVQRGVFEAGQVTVFQSGVYAGTPVANNIRRWGLMDTSELNGLFFELDGLTFNVVARKNGTDTAVAQASFNGDQNFTPGDSNNTYRIFYSAGRAIFCRASNGNLVRLHTMTDSDFPLVDDLDLNIYYENTNDGNTSDVLMRVRGASSSVFGDLPASRTTTPITDETILVPTRSVLSGETPTGIYDNVGMSGEGALYTSNFTTEIAKGDIPGASVFTKFGRNPNISTGTTPEDIWSVGGLYTGQPTGTAETLQLLSSSANDTVAGTGARTVTVGGLDENFELISATVNMNGTTPVTIPTLTWKRLNFINVDTAGSGGANAGNITARWSTTTSVVFGQAPTGFNRSLFAAYTIPANTTALLQRLYISLVRANGSAGSGLVSLRRRPTGGVYNAVRTYNVSNSISIDLNLDPPLIFNALDDLILRVEDVSDSGSQVVGEMGFVLFDNS